jgi:uncharacterized protein YkwD
MSFASRVTLIAAFFFLAASPAYAEMDSASAARLLAAHNQERTALGLAPLRWDPVLAQSAARWAATLAQTDTFEHQDQDREGENLWTGSRGDFSLEEMVGYWVDEKKDFIAGAFPKVSRTPNWADVGHYTQLIWYNTSQVGCAIATNAASDFLVCRYDPKGNWIGENPKGNSANTNHVVRTSRTPRG